MSVAPRLVFAVLLAGCTQGRQLRERFDRYQRGSSDAAAAARSCADELRVLADEHPREMTTALAALSSLDPPLYTLERARRDIDVQKELDAALATIAYATADEGVALERVVSAATRVHRLQARLCEARDVAFTLANVPRVSPAATKLAGH